ncbi:MAG: hypothetical protein RR640_02795 [Oscillospiraceae bacterium]
MKKSFDIPAIEYFLSKNDYTGSFNKTFRFKITPKDEMLKAEIWNKDVCYDLAEIEDSKEFQLNEDGLKSCIDWLMFV